MQPLVFKEVSKGCCLISASTTSMARKTFVPMPNLSYFYRGGDVSQRSAQFLFFYVCYVFQLQSILCHVHGLFPPIWNAKKSISIKDKFVSNPKFDDLLVQPYMIAGWIGVLLLTFILAVTAPVVGSMGWILLSVGTMIFLMLAGTSSISELNLNPPLTHTSVLTDVPADGYCVELGQLESTIERGQVIVSDSRVSISS